MTDVRNLALVGLLGLGLVSLGCSSKSNDTGTGGTNGSGGSSAKGGSGGSSGTGGAGGNGGAAAILGCPASDPPATAEIANFASGSLQDGGLQVMGGVFTYGDTPPPNYSVTPGSVEVIDNVVVSGSNHYQGFGIYFNGNSAGTDCIDASAYTGIQFDISGSLVGDLCTVQFSINDSEHGDSTRPDTSKSTDGSFVPNDPKASGPAGAYAPQLQIGPMIMSSTTTIKVPFAPGTGAPTGGMPTSAIDPKRIEGVQWQLTTPLMGDGAASECDMDITITNVKFYK
jgi:hypothetical protein